MRKILVLFVLLLSHLFLFSQGVDFTYQSTGDVYCSPAVIHFTHQSSDNPVGFVWNFGNGNTSNSADPTTTFTAGTYQVKLIVLYDTHTSSVTREITVYPAITAALTVDHDYICQPGQINFSATSSGNIASWKWDFGDGSVDVGNNLSAPAHTYNDLGNYTATLEVTDAQGCTATAQTTLKVSPPILSATVNRSQGCIPATVSFLANASLPIGSSVVGYIWNFGDGSASVSTAVANTSHLYSNTGKYSPTLSITSSEGCQAQYVIPNLAFGTPPVNLNAYSLKPRYCGSQTAYFVAHADLANAYKWDFGDGNVQTTSDTTIAHDFVDLGVKNITVTPYFNGCAGAPETFTIEVVGVIADYNYANDCTQKNRFNFTNQSQGNVTSYTWNFGDGTAVDTLTNAVHTYPKPGNFATSLIVLDQVTGCSDRVSRNIYTATPSMINPDSAVCRNGITTFRVRNSYENSSAIYVWHIASTVTAPYKDSVLIMKPTRFGTFSNYVTIDNGTQYCKDTVYLDHDILVRGPQLEFTLDSAICLNEEMNIQNHSAAYVASDSIELWRWQYSSGGTFDTTHQPALFLYSGAGNAVVSLFARDNQGCVDSLSKPAVVNSLPFLQIVPDQGTLCAGVSDTLVAFHSDAITWTSSGSLPCVNCDTLVITPSATTEYKAEVTNSMGCTVADTSLFKVFSPFSATLQSPDAYLCPGDSVQLDVGPSGNKIDWLRGAGLSATNIFDPIASPFQTTIYTAVIADSAACFTDSISVLVYVKAPANVDAGSDLVLPYNSPFTLNPQYSNNTVSYLWSPADELSCYSCAAPSGTALHESVLRIEVTTDSGCVASDSIHIFIECNQANLLLPNAFTPNSDQLNDVLYPIARGIGMIKHFAIYNRAGQIVFERNNFSPNDKSLGWDGYVNGEPVSTGVYVYVLTARCDQGEKIVKKGSVILLR